MEEKRPSRSTKYRRKKRRQIRRKDCCPLHQGNPMRKDESKISCSIECKKVHTRITAASQNNALCSFASLSSERSAHYSDSDQHSKDSDSVTGQEPSSNESSNYDSELEAVIAAGKRDRHPDIGSYPPSEDSNSLEEASPDESSNCDSELEAVIGTSKRSSEKTDTQKINYGCHSTGSYPSSKDSDSVTGQETSSNESSNCDSELEAVIAAGKRDRHPDIGSYPPSEDSNSLKEASPDESSNCDSELEAVIGTSKRNGEPDTQKMNHGCHSTGSYPSSKDSDSVTGQEPSSNESSNCDSELEAVIAAGKRDKHPDIGSYPPSEDSNSLEEASPDESSNCDSELEAVIGTSKRNGEPDTRKINHGCPSTYESLEASGPQTSFDRSTNCDSDRGGVNAAVERNDNPETQRDFMAHLDGGDPDDDDDSDNSDSSNDSHNSVYDGDDDDDDDDGSDDPDGGDGDEENGNAIIDGGENPDDPDDPGFPGAALEDSDDDNSSDEEGNNFNLAHAHLNTVCHSIRNCSVREVLALILALGAKHRMTYDAIMTTMRCFNTMYGRKYLPIDKKILWRLLGRQEVGIKKYVYCHECMRGQGRFRNFPPEQQCICGTLIKKRFCKFYFDLNFVRQIQDLLKLPRIRNALRYRQQREVRVPGNMEDILDGSQYTYLKQGDNILASVFNFSYTFNLDGLRMAKRSSSEAWPIYARWNELPPKLRQKHMLLAGVWVDLQHPNMNLYLEQFVDRANFLSNVGLSWIPDGQDMEIRSKFAPTICVVDSQARCKILNMQSPSGYCGCPFCDHRGLYCGGAVHFPYLPPVPIPVRRTDDEIRRLMEAGAANEGRGDGHILGFKGASRLMLMDHFDLSKGIVTDDLHPFSGVIEHHTTLLLTRTRQVRPPYYIGDSIGQIDRRMLSIRTPTHISRKPRSLKTRKRWTGSEWRNWLLYYLVPCLEGILPRPYLRHLQLLAQAIFLVSKDSVSEEDCNDAEDLFRRYVIGFERFFGRENMRYNVHVLLHVADCVREWGPMPGQSTTFYEEWNHVLAQTVTSPNARAEQMVTRFLMYRFLNHVEFNDQISRRVKVQVNNILEQPRLRDNVTIGNITLLGRKVRRPPNARERQLLHQLNEYPQEIIVSKRASVDDIGVEYRSSDYRYAGEETKSDDSHVFTWNDEFAQILTIAMIGEDAERRVVVFLKILNTNAHVNRYVCNVAVGGDIVIVGSFEDIRSHAILCTVPTGVYVMPVCNAWELD